MDVSEDRIVGITYVLRDAEEDEELERTGDDEPFHYLHGHGNIIPGLESALEGLEEGDEFEVELDPEEAYGEYDASLIQRVGRDQFPDDVELKPGTPIQLVPEGSQGAGMIFYIKEIAGDEVVLDGNQPLAGRSLHFQGKVTEVREASDEEVAHGHAHTGHHHH